MKILFDMTIYLSITALIIILIKRLFKNKTSAGLQLYIWAILLIRLFVPALPESKISVYNVVPEAAYERSGEITGLINYIPKASPVSNNSPDYTLLIWGGISAVFLIYFLSVYAIYSFRTKKMPVCTDFEAILNSVKNELNIKRKIRVEFGAVTVSRLPIGS